MSSSYQHSLSETVATQSDAGERSVTQPRHAPEPGPLREVDIEANKDEIEETKRETVAEEAEAYSVFAGFDRYAIVFMVALASLYSPLTANIYFPAIPPMAAAFHKTTEDINVTVTVYMVVQGISPTIFGSVADRKGRRPFFLTCLLILILSTTGIALTPTNAYWLLVVLRCIQAGGSASTVALSAAVIADIIPVQQRGGYMGLVNLGAMLGPSLGPVIGGVLVDVYGWRSIFWFIVIAAGVCLITIALFLPETLRSMVGNGSIPAPRWDRALIPIIGRHTRSKSSTRPPPKPVPNPFLLFTQPDLVLILLSLGIVYAAFYAVSATLSSLFTQHYPFLTETDIGLCFLASGGGGTIGTIFQGKFLDWYFKRTKKRWEEEKAARIGANEKSGEKQDNGEKSNEHDDHESFPIEKATLNSQVVWISIFAASLIGYGWALDKNVSIAVPLVLQFTSSFSAVAIMINIQVLIVDLFPGQGASVTAANNLVRCLIGAIGVAIINIITNHIGPGWTYTLGGFLSLGTIPLALIVVKIGPIMRKKRQEKARLNK